MSEGAILLIAVSVQETTAADVAAYAERYSLPGGGVYMIEAHKQVSAVTPLKLKPRWRVWRPEIAPLGAANSSWYASKH